MTSIYPTSIGEKDLLQVEGFEAVCVAIGRPRIDTRTKMQRRTVNQNPGKKSKLKNKVVYASGLSAENSVPSTKIKHLLPGASKQH